MIPDAREIYKKYPTILEQLLIDHSSSSSTPKNIIWASDAYKRKTFRFNDEIKPQNITKSIIRPRSQKAKQEQARRVKVNAEVFTPSWVCNKQNNLIDAAWFGREAVFNREEGDKWITHEGKITMPKGKNWKDYIRDIRLEITCGEAPYLVSRYDTVTGEPIPIKDRIGLLDRKFRILNERASDSNWLELSLVALRSVYGYEWQGDSLFLARENIFQSYLDYYWERFGVEPSEEILLELAKIISWNLWQMDGLKCVVPNSCITDVEVQTNLFGEEETIFKDCAGCVNGGVYNHNGIYSKIMDWDEGKEIEFWKLLSHF